MSLDFSKVHSVVQTVILGLMLIMVLILCSYCVMLQGDIQNPEPADSVAFGS
jgi:hypothetical protein